MLYLRGLDGVRALAVLVVIAVHVGYLDGGYQGVTVFFVLSGYLITSILINERETTGRIDLRAFYIRRLLRLYPALIVTLLAVPILTFTAAYERRTITAEAGAYAVTYTTNIAQVAGHGFSFFLDHTWSLAVEEQFYLVWPLLLLALVRTGRRRIQIVVGITVALLAARMGVAAHWSSFDAREAPPTDSVGLLLGACIAFAPAAARWARSGTAVLLAVAGFAVVGALMPGQDSAGSETWAIVVTLAASALVIAHVVGDGRLTSLLSHPALVWIGRRSYGLYLYHFPIAAVFHLRVHSKAAAALLTVAVSFAAAAISYRYVEQPFLRLKHRYERTPAAGRPDA